MSLKLEINDSDAPLIAQYYTDKLGKLNERLSPLLKEREDIERMLKQLNSKVSKTLNVAKVDHTYIPSANGYDTRWTMNEKITFVLKNHYGSPLTSRMIADSLFELDSTIIDKVKAAKNISTVLSIGSGKLYNRIKEDGKDNKFTLIDKQIQNA